MFENEQIEQFEQNARNAGGTVQVVPNDPRVVLEAANRALGKAENVIVAELGLPQKIREVLRQLPQIVPEPTDDLLCSVRAGITGAFAAVSSTGSICVRVDDRLTGFASLLAPLHVAVVEAASFVNRPSDLLSSKDEHPEVQSDFVFITGPSATADMGPLVRGVHGPHQLHILVLR